MKWAVGAAATVAALSLVGQKWGMTDRFDWFVDTPENYWTNTVPLAQFVVVSSLAYLALEIFKTSGEVERFVYEFFGRLAPTRVARVEKLSGLAKPDLAHADENRSSEKLYILLKLHNLCYLRSRWTREGNLARPKINATIDTEQDDACTLPWFRALPGRRFLMPFHSGADLIWPTFGLVLAFWVHIMAWAEKVFDLEMLQILTAPPGQLVLPAAMVGCGVVLPLIYSLSGRDLQNHIMDLEDSARVIMDRYEKAIREGAQSSIATIDEHLEHWIQSGSKPEWVSEPAAPAQAEPKRRGRRKAP